MKSRIKDDNRYGGTFTQEHLDVKDITGWTLTDTIYTGSFLAPVWNGSAWVENYTNPNDVKVEQYEEKIKGYYTKLRLRSLQSSMDKKGDYEYLQQQEREYENKYKVANGDIVDDFLMSAIEQEMNRKWPESLLDSTLTDAGVTPAGTQLDKMKQLIILKHVTSQLRLNEFKAFIIDFRTQCRTWIESLDYDKIDQAFSLADTIPEELDMTAAQSIYDNFKLI